MTAAFVLRFQEACAGGEGVRVRAGTQTITNVRAEEMDSDPHGRRFEVLGQQSESVGTRTKTAVPAEHSDDDLSLASLRILPVGSVPSLGTQTMTRVLAESGDIDP